MARNKDGDASSAPQEKKQGRLSQIRDVYRVSKEADPVIGWFMLLSFLVVFGVLLVIGFLVKLPWIFGIFGVLFGVLAATIIMSRRAERAAYSQIEGQAGAAGAALTSIRRGWYTDREPVAADVARPGDIDSAAMVYRALGRPGVVLVGEGPHGPRPEAARRREEARRARRPRCPRDDDARRRPARTRSRCRSSRARSSASSRRSPRTRWLWSTSASRPSVASALPCRPASTRCAPAWTGRPCAASDSTGRPAARPNRTSSSSSSDEPPFACAGARRRCSVDGQRVRTMTVLGTLSCRPRPSRSQTTAGMKRQSRTVRARACTGGAAAPPSGRTCRPMIRWPMVKPDRADEQQVHDAEDAEHDEALAPRGRRLRERQRHAEEATRDDGRRSPSR